MKKKTLITLISVTLVMVVAIAGTLAWLTDRESVLNTFTVGNVDITLDEAVVNEDGEPLKDGVVTDDVTLADRTDEGNNYHLVPGQVYVKDPTVTVVKKNEPSYVRMLVTINCMAELDEIFEKHQNVPVTLESIFENYDSAAWTLTGKAEDAAANTMTYEFRYTGDKDGTADEIVTVGKDADLVLEPLFDAIKVPGVFDVEDMAKLEGLVISLEGQAIQVATFEDKVDDAWKAFDTQYEGKATTLK